MKKSHYLFSNSDIRIGDVFFIKNPFYQLPKGALLIVYRIEKKEVHFLSEEIKSFYILYSDNLWNNLSFLQSTGIDYTYVKKDFNASYFTAIFIQIKRLNHLN